MSEERKFYTPQPAPGAEEFFKDDKEMQELIAKARKDKKPDPEQKPWWWHGILAIFGMGATAVCAGAYWLLVDEFPHPVVPATAMLGGFLFPIALLGYWPGRYRVMETDEKLTLWRPLPLWARGLAMGATRAAFSPA